MDSNESNSSLQKEDCVTLGYERTVLSSLYEFYLEEKFCDFSVKVEGKTFKVHRVVLSSCSDYFQAVFSHDMLESRQECVDLKSVTLKGFEPLIKYAYTGTLTLTLENVHDVVCAATFLQITSAMELCINYLKNKMTFENAEELLHIGEVLSIPTLKAHYREYILENFIDYSETESFLRLDSKTLAEYLIDDKLRTPTELKLLQAALKWYNHDPKERDQEAFEVFDKIRYVADGTRRTIKVASRTEPFISNAKCQEIVTFCDNYMTKATERYLHYDHRTRVRFEHKTLVQMGGVMLFDYEIDDFPILSTEERCGWNKNYFYHTDLKNWCTLDRVHPLDLRSHMTLTEVNDCAIICGGYMYDIEDSMPTRKAIRQVRVFYPSQMGSWDIAFLQHERAQHAAVYIHGSGDNPTGCVYVIGGKDSKQPLGSVERLDCKEGTWKYTKPLPKPLFDHAAAVCQGKIYVSGGVEDRSNVTPNMWCYTPAVNKWHKKTQMSIPRAGHSMATVHDKLYVCGGYYLPGSLFEHIANHSCMGTAETYNIKTKQWTGLSAMVLGVFSAGTCVLDGKIIMAGGEDKTGALNSCIQQYDTEKDEWSYYGELQRPLKGFGLCALTVKFNRIKSDDFKAGLMNHHRSSAESIGFLSIDSDSDDDADYPEYRRDLIKKAAAQDREFVTQGTMI